MGSNLCEIINNEQTRFLKQFDYRINDCVHCIFFLLTSSHVYGVKYTLLTQIAYISVTISQSSQKSGIQFPFLFWASASFPLDLVPYFLDPFSSYLYEVIPSCQVDTRVASLRQPSFILFQCGSLKGHLTHFLYCHKFPSF